MKTIEGYTYKVAEYIGKGYSSTVHKGLNDKNGQEVSIKVIQMAKLEDPINQMLLQLEVSALKALSASKHVLHLFDVYATRNNTYLITQLCEGDLNMVIKERKTFPYFEAVQVMRQLIAGYYDIHRAGFIHRDIKPANIFHRNGVYKYGDFGFAIPYNDVQHHKNYNVGSPVYMPPQALKENTYSISCDIWALGIIFYQLLKGSVPWRAISQQVLYEKIMSEPIQNLTVGLPQVTRQFLSQVLCLDSKLRVNPEGLLSWPVKLQSAPIDIRRLSPSVQRERPNVLRQISTNAIMNQKRSGIYFNSKASPITADQKKTNPCQEYIPVHMLKSQGRQLLDLRNENGEHRQAVFFASNFINYIEFLHRIIKFMQSAAIQSLRPLQISITNQLFREVQYLKTTFQNKNQNNQNRIPGWSQFIKNHRFEPLLAKLKKCENKYRMLYEEQSGKPLSQKEIIEGVHLILCWMDEKSYRAKWMVTADYLLTLFQLLYLKDRYQACQFLRMSKIELIMQGDPYNAVPEHLQKIKKKLLLISP